MTLTARDEQRLVGVHADLVRVVRRAAEITTQRFMVIEGLRTHARQAQLWAQGRTVPGKIVTWTMESKHLHGRAVDLGPLNADGNINWLDHVAFDRVIDAMLRAGQQLAVGIRSGADWDRDGNRREKGEGDSPHFELWP